MRTRRWFALLACPAVSLSAALAGCGGDSVPTVKVVADLPLQGSGGEQSMQMAWAIKHVIEDTYGGQAGPFSIKFESMDNSTKAAGTWDPGKCVENAHRHVSDEAVVGVIGTANSGCSEYEIPILNEAHVAMVSPADTAVGLTKGGPGTLPGQPQRYYPSGTRNFFRVVATDDHQGRVGAAFMKSRGVKSVFVLDDKGLYGRGVAYAFAHSAKNNGLQIVGPRHWTAGSRNDAGLIANIKASGADGIYVGGTLASFGRELIDKIVGSTQGATLLVSDGLVNSSIFGEKSALGGMFGTFPGTRATRSAAVLKTALIEAEPDTQVDPYMVYAAGATEVLLDAICRSNGHREDVIAKLFKTDLETVVGPMEFDKNGDKSNVGRRDYAVYQARDGAWRLFRPRRLSPTRAVRSRPVRGRQGCLRPAGSES